MRVDVSRDTGRVRFSRADAPARPLRSPLVLGPVALASYADPKQEFTLRSILTNPYYMIMIMMAVMAVVMPRMMNNIDPEELKAMQEQMGQGGTMGLLSGILAGDPPPSAKKKRVEGGAGGGGAASGAAAGASGGGGKKKQ